MYGSGQSWLRNQKVGRRVCVLTGVLWSLVAVAAEAPGFSPDPWEGPLTVPREAKAYKVFRVDMTRFSDPLAVSRFELPLPDGRSMVVVARPSATRQRSSIWRGRIEGDEKSMATFSFGGRSLIGEVIGSRGEMYRVDYVAPGWVVVVELDPSKFAPEAPAQPTRRPSDHEPPPPIPPGPGLEPMERCSDAADLIDVLVVYTSAACAAAANNPAGECTSPEIETMQQKVEIAIDETNTTYENSGVRQRVRLAHLAHVDYKDTGRMYSEMDRLRLQGQAETDATGEPPYLDQVHSMRNEFAADVVVLVIGYADFVGYAMPMTAVKKSMEANAFAVMSISCATGSRLCFPHELGHIMGAEHARGGQSSTPPFPFSYGFSKPRPTKASIDPWETIMARFCAPCVALPFWSNPEMFHGGDAMGSAQADNRTTLNETASTVANFRRACELNR